MAYKVTEQGDFILRIAKIYMRYILKVAEWMWEVFSALYIIDEYHIVHLYL